MIPQQHYPYSALADALPRMPAEEFQDLVDDIGEYGLRKPIPVLNGQIVDGRHRYEGCIHAGVGPEFVYLPDDTDALAYILAENVMRRHLDQTQRALVAYRLSAASMTIRRLQGDGRGANLPPLLTQKQAAEKLKVSERSVKHAARVLSPNSRAVPELRSSLEAGLLRVSDAASIVGEPEDVQRRAVEMIREGRAKTAVKAVRSMRSEGNQVDEGDGAPITNSRELQLHVSDLGGLHRLVGQSSIDAIITAPPSGAEFLPRLGDLARFAVHALKPAGVMAVLVTVDNLPAVFSLLNHPDLQWVTMFSYLSPGNPPRRQGRHRIAIRSRPLLVYGMPQYTLSNGDNLVQVPPSDNGQERGRIGNRSDVGMEMIFRRLVYPVQRICEPMIKDSPDTARAAKAVGCSFIGAWEIEENVGRVRRMLARKDRQ